MQKLETNFIIDFNLFCAASYYHQLKSHLGLRSVLLNLSLIIIQKKWEIFGQADPSGP